MPRRRVSKAKKPRKPAISRQAVESTELIEVGPDHPAWADGIDESDVNSFYGPIVKLVPAPGTAASAVKTLEAKFYELGAASVKVMPVAEETKVVVEGVIDLDDDERPLRQVVMDRCERLTNAGDHDALCALLTEAMNHAEG